MRAKIVAGLVAGLSLLVAASRADAATHDVRIPVRGGQVRLADVSRSLCRELGLPPLNVGIGAVDVATLSEPACAAARDRALCDGCQVSVNPDALVLHFDQDRFPRGVDGMRAALRVLTAIARPRATAAQAARYGLLMPAAFDPSRPLVVLVHGLDCANWTDMHELLARGGYQVATFNYPSDQPVADSAALFADRMTLLRRTFPRASVDVVAHSMGGLVARAYVEGDSYAGGVDRLILIGTPNAGTGWSRARMLLEWQEHYMLWRHDPRWRPSWMITDGLGEAGRDIRPGSAFLKSLNARPRRDGVRYTVIAGSQSPVSRVAADSVAKVAGWRGFGPLRRGLGGVADKLRGRATGGDGPVSVKSTRLKGVDDFVLLQADHATLYFGSGTNPPAAWPVVRNRLAG